MKLPYDTIIYIIEIILIIYSNSPVSLLLNVFKQYVLGVYIPHILSIKAPIGVVYTTHTLLISSQWELLTLLVPCSFYRQFMFFYTIHSSFFSPSSSSLSAFTRASRGAKRSSFFLTASQSNLISAANLS